MKKTLLLLLFASLSLVTLKSQIRVGLKGGYNVWGIAGDKGDPLYSNKVSGFSAGPVVEFLFHQKQLGVETGIIYSQRHLKLDNDEKVNTDYLDMPLNMKVYFIKTKKVNPYINVGPYVSFKVSNNEKFTVNRDEIVDQWKAKSFQAGVNIGGGVQIYDILQIGANYGLGLTDNYKESNGKYGARDRVLSVTAAVLF